MLLGLLFIDLFLPANPLSSFNEIDRSSRLISTRFPSSLLPWVGIALPSSSSRVAGARKKLPLALVVGTHPARKQQIPRLKLIELQAIRQHGKEDWNSCLARVRSRRF